MESKVFARAVDRVNTDNREFPEVQMQAIPIMLKEGQTWENYLERKFSEEVELNAALHRCRKKQLWEKYLSANPNVFPISENPIFTLCAVPTSECFPTSHSLCTSIPSLYFFSTTIDPAAFRRDLHKVRLDLPKNATIAIPKNLRIRLAACPPQGKSLCDFPTPEGNAVFCA